MPKKRTPAAERRQETGTPMVGPPPAAPDNWPDTGPGARLRKQADVWQVSCEDERPKPTEPKGKLDTMQVNGPEGAALDWDTVDWRAHEDNVRRLRQRIFTATKKGDWPAVRTLQKLMLRSWSNTLVSVRQVTQRNAGRKTAGVDGEVALTSPDRAELVVQVHRTIRSWQPLPVKRVYIPKAHGRQRPLGIPTDPSNRGVASAA